MRLPCFSLTNQLIVFSVQRCSGRCDAFALPSAGELLRKGTSGEASASMFGPPLPVDRPG